MLLQETLTGSPFLRLQLLVCRALHAGFLIKLVYHLDKNFKNARSWQVLSRGLSGDRITRSCLHTGPDLTVKTRGER